MVAMEGIMYDTTGYKDQREVETKLDLLQNQIDLGIALLKDKQVKVFVNGS